jgi:hypothetical protein
VAIRAQYTAAFSWIAGHHVVPEPSEGGSERRLRQVDHARYPRELVRIDAGVRFGDEKEVPQLDSSHSWL